MDKHELLDWLTSAQTAISLFHAQFTLHTQSVWEMICVSGLQVSNTTTNGEVSRLLCRLLDKKNLHALEREMVGHPSHTTPYLPLPFIFSFLAGQCKMPLCFHA